MLQVKYDVLLCYSGKSLEELCTMYLTKNSGGYTCSLCSKQLRDKYAARDHLECKHFPTYGGYACPVCAKVMNTRNALTSHQSYCNRNNQLY